MKIALRALGKSDVEISNLTPGDAHVILEAEAKRRAEAIANFRRLALSAGFDPIPVEGKIPVQKAWQKLSDSTSAIAAAWTTLCPTATNTGVLTARTPTLDIDIHDEDAAAQVEALVRAQFGGRGVMPVRFGRRPKRALPFRTDTPFAKITANLARPANDPEGKLGQKLEFLANGQQFVADGIHPETLQSYEWEGGAPGELAREDLAPITELKRGEPCRRDAVDLLTILHGYQLPVRKTKPAPKTNGVGHGLFGQPADWLCDYSDHDQVCAMAMRLLLTGMQDASTVNFLRAQIEALEDVDPGRKARRLHEVPAMVTSARAKIGAPIGATQTAQPKPNAQTEEGGGEGDDDDDGQGWPDPLPLEGGLPHGSNLLTLRSCRSRRAHGTGHRRANAMPAWITSASRRWSGLDQRSVGGSLSGLSAVSAHGSRCRTCGGWSPGCQAG